MTRKRKHTPCYIDINKMYEVLREISVERREHEQVRIAEVAQERRTRVKKAAATAILNGTIRVTP